ncbi:MAG: PIN domain-containing protein [Sphingomonas sp.]|jgi:hypothetical protein|uniref:PIN-like domain-containing protein n=1 Tax=Sphingomonas TaxID=13687 RepID=UPI000362AC71|nr:MULTISPECIES: PIN domain-containing protein [Sphingomonas]ATI57077.1 hypothetical protein CP552_15775 [Sphingomonas melonis]MBI0531940.1 hypothetical protein [Sphingomonas sp. TX0522]MBX8846065.1 DUF4935 domain-containing protein [Sphingomonas melonis]MBX8855153.1 DUF4935 domain-containing protein [Sphingomonas melonis]MBX8899967.1 DUF4935 domain-containing protein [Sphingomonas melonis]
MRNRFAWYLDADAVDPSSFWDAAVVSVDANVLLDLYRYHADTRDRILEAISSFGERVWLSDQAATEFFRNRKGVIVSSNTTFGDASAAVDKLSKALIEARDKLRGQRLVPRSLADGLDAAVSTAVNEARREIDAARAAHPDYLREDPLLERLLAIFDERVGAAYDATRLAATIKTAESRFKAKVPPGYMDEDTKEGDRRYGDYVLWSQLMDQAKAASTPVIFVTSEKKEDWWEQKGHLTLGPRLELLEEFSRETGQRIHVYRTERFLELHAARAGSKLNEHVVEEIREVDARRGRLQAPAVSLIEQVALVARSDENRGTLEIELLREVRMATASGRLEPRMAGVPDVAATVTSAPSGCPRLDVRGATGTLFDFNVHLKPLEREALLPVGRYLIEYGCTHWMADEAETG